jgi:hypothetical protein
MIVDVIKVECESRERWQLRYRLPEKEVCPWITAKRHYGGTIQEHTAPGLKLGYQSCTAALSPQARNLNKAGACNLVILTAPPSRAVERIRGNAAC